MFSLPSPTYTYIYSSRPFVEVPAARVAVRDGGGGAPTPAAAGVLGGGMEIVVGGGGIRAARAGVVSVLSARDRFSRRVMGSTVRPTRESSMIRRRFEDEAQRERDTETVLQHFVTNNPYLDQGTVFSGLIAKTKTGQAVVFSGLFRGSPVAIKMFFSESPAEFDQEVRMMRAIPKHPNILELVEALDDGKGRRSVILPMMSRSLENLYDTSGIISPAVLKDYLMQVAHGLQLLHSCGIAHLDLKCGNILMTSSNVCKICDFGMAAEFSGSDNVKFKGTYPFMAPEVWSQSGNCDFSKIDMYAFGMMIWELLAAQHPWSRLCDGSDIEKWQNDIRTKVLSSERPGVDTRWDSSLVSLMARCWAQDPKTRPSSAEAVRP